MNILNFVLANWDNILLVIAALVAAVVLVKRGETQLLKKTVLYFVTKAEKDFGSGTGSLKLAAVSDWIYERIPSLLRLLFTAEDIKAMIETTLTEAKKAWEANTNLKEYINKQESEKRF